MDWLKTIYPSSTTDLTDWVKLNKSEICSGLADTGAILFRGFHVDGGKGFADIVRSITKEPLSPYGDLPRWEKDPTIYHSTPYPANRRIQQHNEGAHFRYWPRLLLLFCEISPSEGGATTISNCELVFNQLPKQVQSEFLARGLRYVRLFHPGFDVSWQDFFAASCRKAVEVKAGKLGFRTKWLDEQVLEIDHTTVAVLRDPYSGCCRFFNQILVHHPSSLGPSLRKDVVELFGERLPRNVTYGDGGCIDDETIALIRRAHQQSTKSISWQAGDVLLLDNVRFAHGREPYSGQRCLFVGIGDPECLKPCELN